MTTGDEVNGERLGQLVEETQELRAGVGAIADNLREFYVPREEFERRERRVVLLVKIGAIMATVLAFMLALVFSIAVGNRAVLGKFNECTTPGSRVPTAQDPRTGHDCFDLGVKVRNDQINSQRLSLNCVAIWIKEGWFPPDCQAVEGRVNELRS